MKDIYFASSLLVESKHRKCTRLESNRQWATFKSLVTLCNKWDDLVCTILQRNGKLLNVPRIRNITKGKAFKSQQISTYPEQQTSNCHTVQNAPKGCHCFSLVYCTPVRT